VSKRKSTKQPTKDDKDCSYPRWATVAPTGSELVVLVLEQDYRICD